MKHRRSPLAQLLHRGALKEIASKLGLSCAAVSLALKGARPGHPAVAEALKMASASGALEAAQTLLVLKIS